MTGSQLVSFPKDLFFFFKAIYLFIYLDTKGEKIGKDISGAVTLCSLPCAFQSNHLRLVLVTYKPGLCN